MVEREVMSEKIVLLDAEANSSEEVIRLIAGLMDADGRLNDQEGYIADVMERELSASTAVGFLVAVPHARSEHVSDVSLAFVRLAKPIKWNGTEEVNKVFQIAVPAPGYENRHLDILAGLFKKAMQEEFRRKLDKAKTAQEVIDLVGRV
jgi:mannitol/fructose-specific phosphotransferase system IIA component (Ntr-type)